MTTFVMGVGRTLNRYRNLMILAGLLAAHGSLQPAPTIADSDCDKTCGAGNYVQTWTRPGCPNGTCMVVGCTAPASGCSDAYNDSCQAFFGCSG